MKNKKLIFAAIASLLMGAPLVACGSGGVSSSPTSSIASGIKLNVTNASMIFGDTLELIATYSGTKTLSWTSSNNEVATVNDGTVKAVGEGSAVITVSSGNDSATCNIVVSFGDVVPTLVLSGIPSSGEVSIAEGSSVSVVSKVNFNGGLYECASTAVSDNPEVAILENGVLKALKAGHANIDVTGSWNGFEGSLMSKTISVDVNGDITIYAGVSKDGNETVTNNIDLSLVSSWEGKSYDCSATLFGCAVEKGVAHKDLSFSLIETDVVILEGNVVSGKSVGTATVVASYTSETGTVYNTYVKVNVTCPIETYTDQVKHCVADEFPVETYFGEGARIISVKQNGVELEVRRGKLIKGLEANGASTPSVEIQTTKGGYVFTNLFAYTAALTKDNIVDTLRLTSGTIIQGYYILDDDIDEAVDFTSQVDSAYSKGALTNRYFAGTFDGQGHTMNALVGPNGMFGGFGNGALITNTHFNFTFAESATVSVGLAKNSATFVQKDWIVTIDNNYFTTTNYRNNTYTLMDFRFNHLVMTNNYVVLTGTDSLPAYTSADQEIAALWRVDAVIFQGPYTAYSGEFVNNAVVTGSFMPMADGVWMTDSAGLNQEWVCYAGNDMSNIGDFQRETTDTTQFGYSIISPYGTDAKTALFGHLGGGWFSGDKLAVLYSSRGDITNGGVKRYNNVSDLKDAGVESIGDWTI